MIVSGPSAPILSSHSIGVQPVAAHDLLKLHDALRGMDLDRLVALARCIERIADLPFGAGVDLRRAEEAGDASARML